MKFTANQKAILPVLTQCKDVADHKGTMPALSNVLLVANGAIKLSATDLYQSVKADSEGEIHTQGAAAVDARMLLERVKQLPGEITFALDGSTLTMKQGSRRFKLPAIPGDEMPKLPDAADTQPLLTIPGDELADLISRVQFAISTDETRLHLNSMLLEMKGDQLTAVATDGHRLSVAVTTTQNTGSFKILIPLKGVLQLKRLCESGDVTLKQDGLTLFAEAGGFEWTCKLADAQYVPWDQVIPKSHTGSALVSREQLLSAAKAVSVAAAERTGGVKLSLGGDTLRLSSESPDTGESEDEVSCKHEGSSVDIGVNARYLIEALASVEAEYVRLETDGELDPIKVTAEGDESGSVGVLMPMKI
jgi:DNA polymerase-3 subunit beta